jgi:phosphate transport system permease protein
MTNPAKFPKSDIETKKTKMKRKLFQKKREASEKRFKYLGLGAVLVACTFLFVLLSTVIGKGIPAFTHHYLKVPVNFAGHVSKDELQKGDYNSVYKNGVSNLLPFMNSRKNKRIARSMVSSGAGIELQNLVVAKPKMFEESKNVWLPMDDFADLYIKGLIAEPKRSNIGKILRVTSDDKELIVTSDEGFPFEPVLSELKNSISVEIKNQTKKLNQKKAEYEHRKRLIQPDQKILDDLTDEIDGYENTISQIKLRQSDISKEETLGKSTPSILIAINGGILKAKQVSRNQVRGQLLVPISAIDNAGKVEAAIFYISTPEKARKFSDIQVALIEHLKSRDLIEKRLNQIFFTHGASREPEQAGILGALIGSLFTMTTTLALAFPLGVATAIYLEEFAPKNRWTYLIEVNINNLAAVPSIIFGLLGLAVFLNWFNLPRSAPLVGGLVLALMTLPTIIIASRAAIKAVPPSIREAALGIGASKVQVVFHHVLPLAMPGMLTGTIIGMAQALGETAPLLMIGMVAFIVDIPATFLDPATVMPVQIYMWADFPEPAFQQKTAAAILVLLTFLIAMNAIAVFLRSWFERRW